jgi:hypothetical protein
MPCLEEWPLTTPCGVYGHCVTGPGGSPSDAESYCECDQYWDGIGDYTSNVGSLCLTNTVVIRSLWSVTTLVAAYAIFRSWSTVIRFYLKVVEGAGAAAGALSHNGGTLNTIGTKAGGGLSDESRCVRWITIFEKMWL